MIQITKYGLLIIRILAVRSLKKLRGEKKKKKKMDLLNRFSININLLKQLPILLTMILSSINLLLVKWDMP